MTTNDKKRKRGPFSANDAITRYFTSTENGIVRDCQNCGGKVSSKKISLAFHPDFLIVQFKRFETPRPTRNPNPDPRKINFECDTFSCIAGHKFQLGVHPLQVCKDSLRLKFHLLLYKSVFLNNAVQYCEEQQVHVDV